MSKYPGVSSAAWVSAKTMLHDTVHVGPHSTVQDYVVMEPYAFVGPRTTVRQRARICAHAYVGEGCEIGDGVIVGENAYIPDFAFIAPNIVIEPGEVVKSFLVKGMRLTIAKNGAAINNVWKTHEEWEQAGPDVFDHLMVNWRRVNPQFDDGHAPDDLYLARLLEWIKNAFRSLRDL